MMIQHLLETVAGMKTLTWVVAQQFWYSCRNEGAQPIDDIELTIVI
jgi:hypothetical protein